MHLNTPQKFMINLSSIYHQILYLLTGLESNYFENSYEYLCGRDHIQQTISSAIFLNKISNSIDDSHGVFVNKYLSAKFFQRVLFPAVFQNTLNWCFLNTTTFDLIRLAKLGEDREQWLFAPSLNPTKVLLVLPQNQKTPSLNIHIYIYINLKTI